MTRWANWFNQLTVNQDHSARLLQSYVQYTKNRGFLQGMLMGALCAILGALIAWVFFINMFDIK